MKTAPSHQFTWLLLTKSRRKQEKFFKEEESFFTPPMFFVSEQAPYRKQAREIISGEVNYILIGCRIHAHRMYATSPQDINTSPQDVNYIPPGYTLHPPRM
jgi:hypothetical protein